MVFCLIAILSTHCRETAADELDDSTGPDIVDDKPQLPTPDWIPAGTVSPAVARRAIEMRARLQSTSPEFQRGALSQISSDIDRFGHSEIRAAAVPLIIDLLSQEYRILQFPHNYRVEHDVRVFALEVLAELGGQESREQIRYSVTGDIDDTVRIRAAQLLAHTTSPDPDGDLHVLSTALLSAVRAHRSEAEIVRLLYAATELTQRVWNPEHPDLLRALIVIHDGAYSRGLRNFAISFLEELANR